MLFIIVTNNEAFIFVKAYACIYLFLVHWRIFKHVNALVLKLLPQSAHSLLGILKDLSSA